MNGSPASPIGPADLLQLWQQRADYLQKFGDPNSAQLWHTAAVELERSLAAFGAETLTLDQAAPRRVTRRTTSASRSPAVIYSTQGVKTSRVFAARTSRRSRRAGPRSSTSAS